jgi:hypothetical protein
VRKRHRALIRSNYYVGRLKLLRNYPRKNRPTGGRKISGPFEPVILGALKHQDLPRAVKGGRFGLIQRLAGAHSGAGRTGWPSSTARLRWNLSSAIGGKRLGGKN